jgi:hypothetical protein
MTEAQGSAASPAQVAHVQSRTKQTRPLVPSTSDPCNSAPEKALLKIENAPRQMLWNLLIEFTDVKHILRPSPMPSKGKVSGFVNAFNDYTSEAGNCHDAAIALMVDLTVAGYSQGWTWVQARVSFGTIGDAFEHSWLEFDGWAVDAASGKCLVMDAGWFREKCRAGDYIHAEATRAWLIQPAGRKAARLVLHGNAWPCRQLRLRIACTCCRLSNGEASRPVAVLLPIAKCARSGWPEARARADNDACLPSFNPC